jgi:hypothetical protein
MSLFAIVMHALHIEVPTVHAGAVHYTARVYEPRAKRYSCYWSSCWEMYTAQHMDI